MRIGEEKHGPALVVRVMDKRIDASSAASFKERMANLIDAGQRHLILNLSDVEFIDSTGLGAIVSLLKTIGEDGVLLIAHPQETVQSFFRLTRMNLVFQVFPSEEEALRSLEKE